MNDNASNVSEEKLISNWQKIKNNISQLAAQQIDSHESCQLLAVSKYADIEDIRTLYKAGQKHFGENYWQSAKEKMLALKDCDITWHFIGALQSNKCKEIAQSFSWVHSVSKINQVELLAQGRENFPALQLCLQVNFSLDGRAGIAPENVEALAREVLKYPQLCLRGLMLLPPEGNTTDFFKLAKLRDKLANQLNISLPTLSMGMSNDYAQAIEAGATIIRIGSAIFASKR